MDNHALCFLQVLREPVVQYLAGSEQRIAPFWNIITRDPTLCDEPADRADDLAQARTTIHPDVDRSDTLRGDHPALPAMESEAKAGRPQ